MKPQLPTTISEGELALRPLSLIDAPDLTRAAKDHLTQRFTDMPTDYTEDMARGFISAPTEELRYALDVQERFCGAIDARLTDDPKILSIGYHTAPWARGRGLMKQAVRLVCAAAFDAGYTTVWADVLPDNAASQAVVKASGFQHTGDGANGCLRFSLTRQGLTGQGLTGQDRNQGIQAR